MKTCPKCKITKNKSEFGKSKSRKDGLQSWCKACRSEHAKKMYPQYKERMVANSARYLERNKLFIVDYLGNHPCVDCEETDILVLEFDHIDNKLFDVSEGVFSRFSIKRLKTEIAKCEVRCANCHKRKTAERINSWRYKYLMGM